MAATQENDATGTPPGNLPPGAATGLAGVSGRLKEGLARLNNQQKIALMVAVAAIFALVIGAFLWSRQPDYKVLFSNLSERDGGAIITALEQLNVPYKFTDGSGAFLLPAEWASANSGAVLKDFLLSRGLLRRLVSVCNLRPVFADALTTASLVLVEAPRAGEALPESIECLFVPEGAALPAPCTPGRPVPVAALCAAPKWDVLLRGLPEAPPPGYVRLGALAGTRRGLATGANGFFHLTRGAALAQGIAPHRWLPCVAKAGDAPGPVFTAADLDALEAAGRPTVFLDLTPPLAPTEAAYVAMGAAEGLDARFLTRNRTPWHAPERLYVAPIWAATFARDRLRFVLNEAGALQLTAFHGIFPDRRDRAFLRALTACLNAAPVADLAEAQLRRYGGGLRKIEPRDLAEIAVPDLRRGTPARLAALGRALTALNEGRRGARARLDRLVEEVAAEIATKPEEST